MPTAAAGTNRSNVAASPLKVTAMPRYDASPLTGLRSPIFGNPGIAPPAAFAPSIIAVSVWLVSASIR